MIDRPCWTCAWQLIAYACVLVLLGAVNGRQVGRGGEGPAPPSGFTITTNSDQTEIRVFYTGLEGAILTQHARPDFRPYLHPIMTPDGKRVVTENSPAHHRHQTGLYWGFTRVNGRDYFHHPEGTHWRKVSARILTGDAETPREYVQWQSVYELLDEAGGAVMQETQIWTARREAGDVVLDLEWLGDARKALTIGQYAYGGLFLRMPWSPGIHAEVVNAARQRNQRAEGQRAPWIDVGMQLGGRGDWAHVAIFDHPRNRGFPQAWRVDNQFGVGPVPTRFGDWHLAQGARAKLQYQLRVYTGRLNDVELNAKWEKFSGQRRSSVLWGIAQQEGRRAKFLSPRAAAQAMTLQPGFEVNVFASEPAITQPMAFCWDDRGRLWIAENRDYETRGRGFSNSGDSRVLILEDTNHDGVADRRKVFLEGIPFPSAIAVGMGGLWLGAPPNLLFVPDRDHDDRADMDAIEVRLTGWGIRDRHETLNSLHWGPDGWLYGCQGFATPSKVGKPKGKGKIYRPHDPFPQRVEYDGPVVDINGGVWRYHPQQRRFEVVAHGFSNPWGIDYDAKGRLVITACVIPHLWYVIPGGIYHRQGGRHFNPYVYRDIQTITDHRHRSAHGGARFYQSDAFPVEYRGRLFMANIHEHAVLTDVLEPRGSGLVGHHGDDFLLANNAQWIGFSVEIGPDGGVYVLDWHDADICGKDVLQKETGRVFRIMPTKSRAVDWPGRYADIATLANLDLAKLQSSPSDWHARRARVVMQQRAAEGKWTEDAERELRRLFGGDAPADIRLKAMWALHVTQSCSPDDWLASLDDDDPHVRAWAIRFLCEDGDPGDAVVKRLIDLCRGEDSAVVRLELAASLQRLAMPHRWSLAATLLTHGEDAEDHNIPHLIWYGIEPLVPTDVDRALELAVNSQIPAVSSWIARRATDAQEYEPLVDFIIRHPAGRAVLLAGMRDALEGRYDVPAPPGWGRLQSVVKDGKPEVQRLVAQLSQQFGDRQSLQRLLTALRSNRAPTDVQLDAIEQLAARRHPALVPLLPKLLEVPALRRAAIRAIAEYQERLLAERLIRAYPQLTRDEQQDTLQSLASRPLYANLLTDALQAGRIPKEDVPAYVARQLRRVVGPRFAQVWGPVDELPADLETLFSKYRRLLNPQALAKADPRHGKEVFQKTCAVCHRLNGEGARIGPDLTGANRGNLEYILANVLTPSAEIQDAYRMTLVLMDDGRVYSGIIVAEDDRYLSLQLANQPEPVSLPKSRIESRETSSVSMMPLGLWTNLPDQDVVDLVRYLQTAPAPRSAEELRDTNDAPN